jgi:hypothetical protein
LIEKSHKLRDKFNRLVLKNKKMKTNWKEGKIYHKSLWPIQSMNKNKWVNILGEIEDELAINESRINEHPIIGRRSLDISDNEEDVDNMVNKEYRCWPSTVGNKNSLRYEKEFNDDENPHIPELELHQISSPKQEKCIPNVCIKSKEMLYRIMLTI